MRFCIKILLTNFFLIWPVGASSVFRICNCVGSFCAWRTGISSGCLLGGGGGDMNFLKRESDLSCIFMAMNYWDKFRSRKLFPLLLVGTTWFLYLVMPSAEIDGVSLSSLLGGGDTAVAVGCLWWGLSKSCLDLRTGLILAGLNTLTGTC